MRGYDDVTPIVIWSGLKGVHLEWTNSGEFLALAGHLPEENPSGETSTPSPVKNVVKFYTRSGTLRYTHVLPSCQVSSKK